MRFSVSIGIKRRWILSDACWRLWKTSSIRKHFVSKTDFDTSDTQRPGQKKKIWGYRTAGIATTLNVTQAAVFKRIVISTRWNIPVYSCTNGWTPRSWTHTCLKIKLLTVYDYIQRCTKLIFQKYLNTKFQYLFIFQIQNSFILVFTVKPR